jgi:nucleoside-diphosphate-sugar epimerase
VLITGACGEMGHGLIETLAERGDSDIVALDLRPPPEELRRKCRAVVVGDILDKGLLARLASEYEVEAIFHLAALLSTRAEYAPMAAHKVNVGGTLNLLQLAADQGQQHGRPVRFLFPSSIAVYGLPDLATKTAERVREFDWNTPTTMYGCNKLYCEHIGRYMTDHFRQLDANRLPSGVDFRALRFPGLISAVTTPSGGTSDFAPEMVHAAAQGKPCACFVRQDARIPFMAMVDGIRALVALSEAPKGALSQRVYNIGAFSLDAGQIAAKMEAAFPGARISFDEDLARAAIVDSWPARVNDEPARADWGWSPIYDENTAFEEHLIPLIARRYAAGDQT